MVAVKSHKRNPAQTAHRAHAKLNPVEPQYITKAEGVALLDRQAQKYLNMSGEEFRRKYRSGELTFDDHPDVVRVAMLLSFGED